MCRGRDIQRCLTLLSCFIIASALSSCEQSRRSDLIIDVVTKVDDHDVFSKTRWHTRVQVIGSVNEFKMHGIALKIPVKNGEFIYGIFRLIESGKIYPSVAVATLIDHLYIYDHKRLFPERIIPSSPAALRDQVLEQDENIAFPICRNMGSNNTYNPHQSCIVFVYFSDPRRPESLKIIYPHKPTMVFGKVVLIDSASLRLTRTENITEESRDGLPGFLANKYVVGLLLPHIPPPAGPVWSREDFER